MADSPTTPEPEGQVSDAVQGNWVDHYAPAATRPYLRLSRADRPIGTWLLFLPCLFGLGLAILADGHLYWRDGWTVLACGIGAFLMRGAGCTWNDITDRDIDAKVERTRSRPLPSGQVSVTGAYIWMFTQAALAFVVLLTFYPNAIVISLISIGPVLIYPFAKRFTWWPQVFLGIAFNWGALVGWTAHAGELQWPAIVIYLSGIAWTLFYDTIYAHQDIEDDTLIGVKSTARLFMDDTPKWLLRFMIISISLMGVAIIMSTIDRSPLSLVIALGGAWAMGWHLSWQLRVADYNDPEKLKRLFQSNRDAGLIPLLFFAVAFFV